MKKKGLTLVSMVIYVALFFAFMTFAVSVSSNMGYTSLAQKGQVINVENFEKLQYNVLNSAKDSVSVDKIGNGIVFSNDDEYLYDSVKKVIFKNNSLLADNITKFEIVELNNLTDVPTIYLQQRSSDNKYVNIEDNKQYVCINVSCEKYGVQNSYQLFCTVGDGVD